MNNILVSLKKFITNKNTVTVLGVIVILGLLYWGYNSTIESQVRPIRVPVATQTISPGTLIEDNMISYIEVPYVSVPENVIRSSTSIIGKSTTINSIIPAGSMFYSETITDKENLPGSIRDSLDEDEYLYILEVDLESSYYNEILPNSPIDIYMKAKDENGQIMLGRLLSQVKILAVKDSNGENVFDEPGRETRALFFAVPKDVFELLEKAESISSVDLFPSINGKTDTDGTVLRVDREELVDYINSHSVPMADDEIVPGESENNSTGTE